jgi:hypothetical protein
MARATRALGRARTMDWYSTGGLTTSPYGAQATTADGASSQSALIVPAGATPGDAAHELFIYGLGERTVTRIRGDLNVGAIKSAATAQGGHLYFGIAVVPWEAYDAGAASMPNPYSDPEYDWLYWRLLWVQWRVHDLINGFTGATYQTHLGGDQDYQRIELDSRAQRKMRKGELPVACWHWRAVAGTPSVFLSLGARVLLKQ